MHAARAGDAGLKTGPRHGLSRPGAARHPLALLAEAGRLDCWVLGIPGVDSPFAWLLP